MQRTRKAIALALELATAIAGGHAATNATNERQPTEKNDERCRREFEEALRCARGTDDDSRRGCFGDAIAALNQWSDSPARREAFSRAESTFSQWPDRQRATGTHAVLWETQRRVLDTMRLTRELTDWYPEDTDRTAADRTLLTIQSELARDITAFTMVRAPVRYHWFSQGPGLSRLRSLTLQDVDADEKTFDQLLRWSALATLERLRLRDERPLVRCESLWTVLRATSELRSLIVEFFGASDAAQRLRVEPAVSGRLRELSLASGYLSSRDVDALVENRALSGLITLDLRGNSLTEADISRLRSAPQFARTEIIVSPKR